MIAIVASLCAGPTAKAESDGQLFRVSVANSTAVQPPNSEQITLETSQLGTQPGPVAFPEQVWRVDGNSPGGTVVEFAVAGAFFNTSASAASLEYAKRDATLSVSLQSSDSNAGWVLPITSDTTQVHHADETALVRAESHGAGAAEIGLTVSFENAAPVDLVAGQYTTTVLVTVTVP